MTKDDRKKKLTAIEFTRVKLTNPHLSPLIKIKLWNQQLLGQKVATILIYFSIRGLN